jgi:CRISPR-associated endonuclease/helicase Cas3
VLHGVTDSPLARHRFAAYFERLYYGCNLDKADICELLTVGNDELAISFRTAAESFRLIDDEGSLPIVVRYYGTDDGQNRSIDQWLAMLRRDGPQRWLMRKLQRHTINLRREQALTLLSQGDIEEIVPGLYVQINDWLYDENLGFVPEGKDLKADSWVV